MLFGEYRHNLDPKNRIFIPAKHRDELGEEFVVVKSIREKCLRVYAKQEWEAYIEQIKKLDGRDKDRIIRALNRNGAQVSPDSQGRIVLTPDLIAHAQIAKNAVIVGCGDYAEIWSDANYAAMVDEEDLDNLKDIMESFGL